MSELKCFRDGCRRKQYNDSLCRGHYLDAYMTDAIVCPYCLFEHEASLDFMQVKGNYAVLENATCARCLKDFKCEASITIKYSSLPIVLADK